MSGAMRWGPVLEGIGLGAMATALAAGKKSLSFPDVQNPSCELLEALSRCSGELALTA